MFAMRSVILRKSIILDSYPNTSSDKMIFSYWCLIVRVPMLVGAGWDIQRIFVFHRKYTTETHFNLTHVDLGFLHVKIRV